MLKNVLRVFREEDGMEILEALVILACAAGGMALILFVGRLTTNKKTVDASKIEIRRGFSVPHTLPNTSRRP